jgi:anaphase-promoting complex subunit 8
VTPFNPILDVFSSIRISFHEAADSLKRALAVAARDDTIIKSKLARIYETLEDPATATAYHLQYIETCERLGKGVSEYAHNCIVAAKYLLSVGTSAETEFALGLLRKTANSNAEENQQAKELLAKLEA